jgi:LmbE family N-acetylglucosaminyl deacetylase
MTLTQLPIENYGRLLVVSPHPDDETLIAAVLMQRILAQGGEVRVVITTNGDCQQTAPRREYHHLIPRTVDYIKLGNMRQKELVEGLGRLGVADEHIYFLGYPDLGLSEMWAHYWDPSYPFRSSSTKATRSPYPRTFNPDSIYAGEHLYKDLVKIIDGYRPDLITVTNSFDTHPDHRAVEMYTRLAMATVQVRDPAFQADAYGSLVHRAKYPHPTGIHTDLELLPPPNLTRLGVDWLRVDLEPYQIIRKLSALRDYRSQMAVMGDFLEAFGRKNELFTTLPVAHLPQLSQGDSKDPSSWRDAHGAVVGLLDRSPSMDFYADALMPATDIVKTFAAKTTDRSVWVALKLRGKARRFQHYHLGILAIDAAGDLHYLHASNHPRDETVLSVVLSGKYVVAEFPIEWLVGARYLFIGGLVTGPHSIVLDNSNWPLVTWP